jgi:hypothetical protein
LNGNILSHDAGTEYSVPALCKSLIILSMFSIRPQCHMAILSNLKFNDHFCNLDSFQEAPYVNGFP